MRNGRCSASPRVPACTASTGCPATGKEQPNTARRHELESRGRHRGHLHRSGGAGREHRRAAIRQAAIDAAGPGAGGARRAVAPRCSARAGGVAGAGDHGRHQCRARALRCTGHLSDDRRLRGHPLHPAHRQAGPVRLAVAEAAALRRAPRLSRRGRARHQRRHGAASPHRRRAGARGCRRRAAAAGSGFGCRHRHQSPLLVRESRPRARAGAVSAG